MSESTAPGTPKTGELRRRVKVLAWRAMLGGAYAAGTAAVTLVVRWVVTLF